jgi:hypothetical protein
VVDSHRVSGFILLSLVVILGLLPPETRGESMAGCAALVALLAVLQARQVPVGAGHAALILVLVLAWPLVVSAVAPGSAVVPLAVVVVGITAGVHASSLAGRLGQGLAVPLTLSATAVALSLYALAQKMWLLEARAERLAVISGVPDRELVLIRLGQGRAFEPFPTPAALGCYLAMILPVTLGLAISTRGRTRWVFVSATGLLAAGLLSTMSVTAAAALAVAGAAGLVFRGRGRRGLLIASALGLVVVVGVIALRGGGVTDLSRWDHPWRLRAGNFRIATEVIADHPWTGVGPGGFGEVFPQYRGPHDNETQHVHDVVLELGAEIGVVPGAIASLAFFVLFLGPVFRRDEIEPWKRGLAVGLAAFAIQNLVDFTAFLPSLLWLAALLRGLLVRPRLETAESPRPAPAFVLGSTLAATFLAAAIVVVAGLSWNARFRASRPASRLRRVTWSRSSGMPSVRRASRPGMWIHGSRWRRRSSPPAERTRPRTAGRSVTPNARSRCRRCAPRPGPLARGPVWGWGMPPGPGPISGKRRVSTRNGRSTASPPPTWREASPISGPPRRSREHRQAVVDGGGAGGPSDRRDAR